VLIDAASAIVDCLRDVAWLTGSATRMLAAPTPKFGGKGLAERYKGNGFGILMVDMISTPLEPTRLFSRRQWFSTRGLTVVLPDELRSSTASNKAPEQNDQHRGG